MISDPARIVSDQPVTGYYKARLVRGGPWLAAIKRSMLEEIDCPECDGDGTIDYFFSPWNSRRMTCPQCGGWGKVRNPGGVVA